MKNRNEKVFAKPKTYHSKPTTVSIERKKWIDDQERLGYPDSVET